VFQMALLFAAEGDLSTSLSFLTNALTKYLIHQDHGPLKYSIWNAMTWIHFCMGGLDKADALIQTLPKRDREHSLMRIWVLEYTIAALLFKGDFHRAGKNIMILHSMQAGHKGSIFCSALKGILAVCKKDYLSYDADTRDDCINNVIFACQKLAAHNNSVPVLPIAILCLFLSAHCAIAAYSHLGRVIGLRKGGGVEFRLKQAVRTAINALQNTAKVIPFVELLTDALRMKFDVALHKFDPSSHSKREKHTYPTSETMLSSSEKNLNKHFNFGLAFWYVERSQYCGHYSLFGDAFAAEAELAHILSTDLLKCFKVPNDHFLLGALVDRAKSVSSAM
jgi:hypothetical protein